MIIDGPAGYNSDICLPLQEELSSLSRVCIFDRAGVGKQMFFYEQQLFLTVP